MISKSNSAFGPKDLLLMLKRELSPQGLNYAYMSIFYYSEVSSGSEMSSFIWTAAAAAESALLEPTYKSIVSENSPCQPSAISLVTCRPCDVNAVQEIGPLSLVWAVWGITCHLRGPTVQKTTVTSRDWIPSAVQGVCEVGTFRAKVLSQFKVCI